MTYSAEPGHIESFRDATGNHEKMRGAMFITFQCRDALHALDINLLTTKYAGTNAMPAGVEGTTDDIGGTPKPVLLGTCKNVTPKQVNTSKKIYQIDGVRGLVLCGQGIPAEIPAPFVYDVQSRQAAGEFDHTPAVKCTYRPGDKAKVTLEGPYRDLIGEVITATDAGRVELMLNAALNWKTSIDSDHLEEVPIAA